MFAKTIGLCALALAASSLFAQWTPAPKSTLKQLRDALEPVFATAAANSSVPLRSKL